MNPFLRFGCGLLFLLACLNVRAETGFDPGTVDYRVTFKGKQVGWREFAFYVMPGEVTELSVHLPSSQLVALEAGAGELRKISEHRWQWRAPSEPGRVQLVVQPENTPPMTLHVLVMVAAEKVQRGYLNGYRIGRHPDKLFQNNPIYRPPSGFIEVHEDMVDLQISPHFTLGQFLCKQQPDHWPKYLVLRESLVAKLEVILAEVNRRGIRTDSFHVMSGYRTPWYNQTIGNSQYSRHVWGGAADIFVDTNGDGRMDDLNGDGRIDMRDAQLLLDIVEDIHKLPQFQRFHGGLGLYGPRAHRGPFVHVDARGFEARWTIP
ncbi:D-Ala-D-Ala carboxypeptidase family metallohydrolase [Marinimicrobium sp. ABcell2]|uniref:D-Ala-D-Ala carboxypeptidase family metallohydrolase n=1 Tax=Marinimicrobium sp. ABcell2 TaxID=3069751 RepID=UPI0027ADF6E9|nr:D-Ala-D-Ala carboxypeptidase family metallohydrolase [Marinimicrobium sp. ABcell2]MDQ2076088.1 D-Ala-D-Ala carboxypeptidase family metallohydrolase [Marinimicrobium sp. ABcell2]